MIKRPRTAICILFAAIVGLSVFRIARPSQPVYEGKTLSRWLEGHVPTSGADPPYGSPGWKKADEALRHIGTNAIPTLLEMLRAKDPPPIVLKLLDLARKQRLVSLRYRYAEQRNMEAAYAFETLGASAAGAVPTLIKIYEAHRSASSRMYTAQALGHIGPAANAAIPVLVRDFSRTNGQVRFDAVSAVMQIGGEPSVVVPALTSVLQDSNVSVRRNALVGLSRFGGRARPVVPEILNMLNDPGMVGSSSITQQVVTALWRIAPEKVGKPLVVEDATPMIANGVTTQALKLACRGERHTLIPPGRPVPALAQYWSSDPRPYLSLYRGAVGSEREDQFLGQFEVLGLPAEENLNVSTLCVVADGRIILCARENHQDQFLEIRRVADDALK